jgi:glycosyltransferase involved in cell wall biosynthesis
MSRRIAVWNDLLAFISILKYLRREQPDIVHTHTAKAGALGRVAAWLCRVPVIVHTYHGNVFSGYFSPSKSRAYLATERLLGRLSSHVIAVSGSQWEEICTKYRVVPHHKASAINNGFDLEGVDAGLREAARAELGFAASDQVVVWAGRMVPVKNVTLLGQIIRIAAQKNPVISFLVVGDGEDRPQLENLIAGCSNARLTGWQKDMKKIWAAADVALLTSRNEGTPTILIEAMAAGVPFVATNVGGVKDLAAGALSAIPNNMGYRAENGFLTEQTPEALLYGITQIVSSTSDAARMASAGQKFVLERFSSDRLLADLRLLYRVLLDSRKGSTGMVGRSEMESSRRRT